MTLSHECERHIPRAQIVSDEVCQQSGLIVAALREALRMQRHGDDQIDGLDIEPTQRRRE
jgi:hypothetical protein